MKHVVGFHYVSGIPILPQPVDKGKIQKQMNYKNPIEINLRVTELQ